MRKDEYDKYLDPDDFKKLYEEWSSAGKPTGNHPLYLQIWDGVTNAVKACIGSLQSRYHCQYQNYDEKVLDGTITVTEKLLKMNEPPRNIVSMSYLPVLGICAGTKAINAEKDDTALSIYNLTKGGDAFEEIMYIDEDGTLCYNY